MNFPNLRRLAEQRKMNAQSRALQEELKDALNIIDVFVKLDHLAQGLVCKPSRKYFIDIGDDGFSIRFEITKEQAQSIERLEKATKIKEIPA